MFSISDYPTISVIFLILFALPSIKALIDSLGLRKGMTLYLILGIFAICIETLGLLTGFPYGQFEYHATLGGKIAGIIPWTIIFAYPPLVIGSYAVAQKFSYPKILTTTLLLLGIDLVIDPGAVSTNMWSFQNPGYYYGVPLTNFAGWLLSGSLAATIIHVFKPQLPFAPISASTGLINILAFWILINLMFSNILPILIGILLLLIIKKSSSQKSATA